MQTEQRRWNWNWCRRS